MTHKSVLELIICHFALVVAACGPAAAEQPSLQVDTSRVLYDFDKPELANNWQIVNDGVMGGRSSSRLTISGDGTASFLGDLSLENNGGFASVRSRPAKLVSTPMSFSSQGNDGSFMRLFQFISGSNSKQQKVSMTTPVFMEPERENSTAQMAFVIPSQVADEGVPEPSNKNVQIREREGGLFAVRRFSGQISE